MRELECERDLIILKLFDFSAFYNQIASPIQTIWEYEDEEERNREKVPRIGQVMFFFFLPRKLVF